MPPSLPLLRWGFILSLTAVALALFLNPDLQFDGHIGSILQYPFSSTEPQQETFCYQGVRTTDGPSSPEPSGATCFTVQDGKFASVFNPPKITDSLNVLPGYAYPGLWDGHGHLLQYGEFLHSVDLFGSTSLDEVRGRVRKYLDSHPGAGGKEEWVRGVGWDQMNLGVGMPTAAMLESDPRLQGLYIMLDRVDVHCIWVSQAVLSLLPEDLPDVPGGEIVRQPGMGVFCDNAMDVVMAIWPRPGPDKKKEYVRSAMKDLHSLGLVGMHDAGVNPTNLELYEDMAVGENDGWSLRVYAMIECEERNTFCPEAVRRVETENGLLFVRSVKLFADGALGSWGSAMLTPYSDRPDTTGSLLVNASSLTSLTNSWAAAGYQVNIHAIGDLANRLAIDAFESTLQNLCSSEDLRACQLESHRFRIEHAQIIHPSDQARMRSLGIVPSIQPTHATSDSAYAGLRLGSERIETEAYRMRSVWDLGPVLGSDFPVEPANPFAGIYAAVTRRRPSTGVAGPPGSNSGWCVNEALEYGQALAGFTETAARGAFLEGLAGRIGDGYWADWIVLENKLEEMHIDDFRNIKVKETWVGGRRVFAR